MKKFTIYYLLLFAVLFNLASCDKKDDDTPAPSKQELLTNKTWKTSKMLVDGVDMSQIPLFAFFLQTEYKFNTNKTYDATLLTAPLGSGTWEFASNETVIVQDAGTDEETRWTIVELKENSLKVTEIDPDDNTKTDYEFVPKK